LYILIIIHKHTHDSFLCVLIYRQSIELYIQFQVGEIKFKIELIPLVLKTFFFHHLPFMLQCILDLALKCLFVTYASHLIPTTFTMLKMNSVLVNKFNRKFNYRIIRLLFRITLSLKLLIFLEWTNFFWIFFLIFLTFFKLLKIKIFWKNCL